MDVCLLVWWKPVTVEDFVSEYADNFDYNNDTLMGHDTTHIMGIIACQTSASSTSSAIL